MVAVLAFQLNIFLVPNGCEFFIWTRIASEPDTGSLSTDRQGDRLGGRRSHDKIQITELLLFVFDEPHLGDSPPLYKLD